MNNISAVALAAATGLVVTGASGFTIIPFLRKVNFGQITEAFERKWYECKSNIPTMGGVMIALGTFCAVLLTVITDKLSGGDIIASGSLTSQEMYTKFWSGLMAAFAFALIGAVDDYAKITGKSGLGLRVSTKHIAIFFVTISFLLSCYMGCQGEPYMFIPFAGMICFGFFYWIFGVIFISAYVNSVNLAYGVDGICEINSLITSFFLGIASALKGNFGAVIICASLAGASIGFLLWNKKVAVGSIGPMYVGGITVAIAYFINCPLILILCGASYIVLGICEMLRVIYYKLSDGKRLFKAAPLQFHFKECGMKSRKINFIFAIIDIIGGMFAIIILNAGKFFG